MALFSPKMPLWGWLRNTQRKFASFFLPIAENNFRPYSLRAKAIVFYIALALVIKIFSISSVAILPRTDFFANVSTEIIFYLTNLERRQSGLPPLVKNPVLSQAAFEKGQDMIERRYFAHNAPDGTTPWHWFHRNNYIFRYAGENLAIDFFDSHDIVRAWMDSPSHRQNILNANYREIGLVVLQGDIEGRETTLVVQFFGTPRAKPQIPPKIEPQNNIALRSPAAAEQNIPEKADPQETPAITITVPEVPPPPQVVAGITEASPPNILEAPTAILAHNPALSKRILTLLANPEILYILLLIHLALALLLGFASRSAIKPQVALGCIFAIFFISGLLYMPETTSILNLQARVPLY